MIQPKYFQSDHIPGLGSCLVVTVSTSTPGLNQGEYHVTLPDSQEGPVIIDSKRFTQRYSTESVEAEMKEYYTAATFVELLRTEAEFALNRYLSARYAESKDPAYLGAFRLRDVSEAVFRQLALIERYLPLLQKLNAVSPMLKEYLRQANAVHPVKVQSLPQGS